MDGFSYLRMIIWNEHLCFPNPPFCIVQFPGRSLLQKLSNRNMQNSTYNLHSCLIFFHLDAFLTYVSEPKARYFCATSSPQSNCSETLVPQVLSWWKQPERRRHQFSPLKDLFFYPLKEVEVGSVSPLFTTVCFSTIFRWLALGFLKHQQYDESYKHIHPRNLT